MNYYNDSDAFCCQWLRNLIDAGLIPNGDVDERPIQQVQPSDVVGYTQCHWFCGIAGWPLALQLAGWPADRPVWTGSCPCQPYSAAGKRKGNDDARNLWPDFFRLIRECRPAIVFGEQVASSAVVGAAGQSSDVQEMRDREAVFGVLRELQGQPGQVQGMHESSRATAQANESRSHISKIQIVEGRQPRACTCKRGEASCEGAGLAVQSGLRRHSKADRLREVRIIWDQLRAVGAESLECSFAGSDRLNKRLYDGQRAGSSICPKCHGERVGTEQDFGDCVGDFSEAPDSFRRIIKSPGHRAPTPNQIVWLDGISADLEAEGYAVGSVVLGAHSVGAPHIRQRLYWVAHSQHRRSPVEESRSELGPQGSGESCGLADSNGRHASTERQQRSGQQRQQQEDDGAGNGLELPDINRWRGQRLEDGRQAETPWSGSTLILCRDGKHRRIPVEPEIFPLAPKLPGRVGQLRAGGNAVCVEAAAEFIRAYMMD